MRYRKLDNNGDMVFGHSENDFLYDTPQTAAQAVLTRLKLWLGEWFLDVEDGTPYNAGMLGKHTKDSIDLEMRQRIVETRGVTAINEYESTFNPDTRNFEIRATITTAFGETTINGVL